MTAPEPIPRVPEPGPGDLSRTSWEHLSGVFGDDPPNADAPSGEWDSQAAADAQAGA